MGSTSHVLTYPFNLAFVDRLMNCVYQQWLSKQFLSPCSYVLHKITSVFNAVLSGAPKVTSIQLTGFVLALNEQGFLQCLLTF